MLTGRLVQAPIRLHEEPRLRLCHWLQSSVTVSGAHILHMCPRTDGDESCVLCEARRHLPLSSTVPLRVPFTEASQRRTNAKPQPSSWAPRKQASRRCLWPLACMRWRWHLVLLGGEHGLWVCFCWADREPAAHRAGGSCPALLQTPSLGISSPSPVALWPKSTIHSPLPAVLHAPGVAASVAAAADLPLVLHPDSALCPTPPCLDSRRLRWDGLRRW